MAGLLVGDVVSAADPILVAEVFDENGARLRQLSLKLSSLRRHA